jgi:hypothetical protein
MTKKEAYELVVRLGNAAVKAGLINEMDQVVVIRQAIEILKPDGYVNGLSGVQSEINKSNAV